MEYLLPLGLIIGLIIVGYLLLTYVRKNFFVPTTPKNDTQLENMSEQERMDLLDRIDQEKQMDKMDATGQMNSMSPMGAMGDNLMNPIGEDYMGLTPKELARSTTRLCGMQTQQPIQNIMTPDVDGSIQQGGGDYKIPMDEESGTLLPGKVGTFSPTYACDRFICDGCTSCAPVPAKDGCKMMTDDMGRNPIVGIEKMREEYHSEFPQYRLS